MNYDYLIESDIEMDCEEEGQLIWKEVWGSFQAPNYLSTSHYGVRFFAGNLAPSTVIASLNGYVNVQFVVTIPCSVYLRANISATVAPILLFGHEFLQDRGQARDAWLQGFSEREG